MISDGFHLEFFRDSLVKLMPKLLVVSWMVHPSRSASSVIVTELARVFEASEMVIAGEIVSEQVGEGDDEWSEDRPPVTVYHIDPFVSASKRGAKYTRWLKIRAVIRNLQSTIEKEGCDRILVIFPDEFYLYAAYSISRRVGLPLFIWFHNTYLENRSGIRKQFAKWLQPRVFAVAKGLFAMSEGMLDYYKEAYPAVKFKLLRHGFKPPGDNVSEGIQSRVDRKVKFAYTGSLNESCRDASLRLLGVILRHPEWEVHVFGESPRAAFPDSDSIVFHGFVPEPVFYARLAECDVVLLPHGLRGGRSDVEYRTIFPTRTIPLLHCGRPILAHTPEDSSLTRFLIEHECAEIVDEPEERLLLESIDLLLNDRLHSARIVRNALVTADLFNLTRIREFILREVFES
jgi:hypothetical protein